MKLGLKLQLSANLIADEFQHRPGDRLKNGAEVATRAAAEPVVVNDQNEIFSPPLP
jgi:hypothetical protein